MSNQNWETPPEVFQALDQEFHFTLDGAADQNNTKCANFLSEVNSAHEYRASPTDIIFCNPPYADMDPWIATFVRWSIEGATVVVLHLPSVSPDWFSMLWATADEYRLVYPRIHFIGTKTANMRDNAISVWYPGCIARMPKQPKVSRWTWQ